MGRGDNGGRDERGGWFPFSRGEIEFAVAGVALLATVLSLLGLDGPLVVAACGGAVVVGYLAGLLVASRRARAQVEVIEGGALRGEGYVRSFRAAKRSLLVMHLDDDSPSDELQGLYRTLLDDGVQIRRTIFLRNRLSEKGYDWIVQFGDHPNLQQRAIPPEMSELVRIGFAVVDDGEVLLAVPGHQVIDRPPYQRELVLRHLVRIQSPQLAAVFARLHEELWESAEPMECR